MGSLGQFIKSYWEYFLDLEEQLYETRRFVAFDLANTKTYSIEYLKLYQAVCSEIDVVGKEIAVALNPRFKINYNTNIKKWGYEVQQAFPMIKSSKVIFNGETLAQPFKNWEYELHTITTKKGEIRTNLRIKGNKTTIVWWKNYNNIKHRRIGLVEGTKNFQLANQGNLIQAFSALFILETLYMEYCSKCKNNDLVCSRLFTLFSAKGGEGNA